VIFALSEQKAAFQLLYWQLFTGISKRVI